MSTWNIDSGDGSELTAGISSEIVARRVAREMADERGESVYLYEVGPGDGESPVESEEIAPACVMSYADASTLDGIPSAELVHESERAGDTGAVPAYRDDDGVWQYVQPSMVSHYETQLRTPVTTVYVDR